jgi:hypothetical protein
MNCTKIVHSLDVTHGRGLLTLALEFIKCIHYIQRVLDYLMHEVCFTLSVLSSVRGCHTFSILSASPSVAVTFILSYLGVLLEVVLTFLCPLKTVLFCFLEHINSHFSVC